MTTKTNIGEEFQLVNDEVNNVIGFQQTKIIEGVLRSTADLHRWCIHSIVSPSTPSKFSQCTAWEERPFTYREFFLCCPTCVENHTILHLNTLFVNVLLLMLHDCSPCVVFINYETAIHIAVEELWSGAHSIQPTQKLSCPVASKWNRKSDNEYGYISLFLHGKKKEEKVGL